MILMIITLIILLIVLLILTNSITDSIDTNNTAYQEKTFTRYIREMLQAGGAAMISHPILL